MFVDRQMIRTALAACAGIVLLQSGLSSAAETAVVRAKSAPSVIENSLTGAMIETAEPIPFYDEAGDLGALRSDLNEAEENIGAPGSTESRDQPNGAQRDLLNEIDTEVDQSNEAALDPLDDFGDDFGSIDKFDTFPGYRDKWAATQYPWKAIGTLYFTAPGGTGSCSASVIGRRDAIVTAAHCCYNRDTRSWYSNWVFVPGKDRNTEPYGRFAYTSARVLGAWITSGGRQNDVCVIKTRTGLSSRTGWLGRSWNQPQNEHVFTFGYPGNKDGGLRQNACASENYPNCGSALVNATGCDKTYGDSGAPWIRVYRPRVSGAANYVNSVTSGWDTCTGSFGRSYNGARFTDANIVPLCSASVCD